MQTNTRLPVIVTALAVMGIHGAAAADRFYAYNLTTATDFDGLYLAPAGTTAWGPNQTLNDKDKTLDHGERLRLSGIRPGRYDVKITDGHGHVCFKRNVDLTRDTSFEIRDEDLATCR